MIKIGDLPNVLVVGVTIQYERGQFGRATVELILPSSFGVTEIKAIDFDQLFKSPEVAEAINLEVQRQARKIRFKDK